MAQPPHFLIFTTLYSLFTHCIQYFLPFCVKFGDWKFYETIFFISPYVSGAFKHFL